MVTRQQALDLRGAQSSSKDSCGWKLCQEEGEVSTGCPLHPMLEQGNRHRTQLSQGSSILVHKQIIKRKLVAVAQVCWFCYLGS